MMLPAHCWKTKRYAITWIDHYLIYLGQIIFLDSTPLQYLAYSPFHFNFSYTTRYITRIQIKKSKHPHIPIFNIKLVQTIISLQLKLIFITYGYSKVIPLQLKLIFTTIGKYRRQPSLFKICCLILRISWTSRMYAIN